jgi:UDP-glucose 4-epimerase
VYGPGLKKQLLWDLCNKLHKNADRVHLGGTGNELRDWVAVGDAARILSRIGPLACADVPKFNLGTGVGTTVCTVAECLVEAWNGRPDAGTSILFSGESRPGDPFSLVAAPDRLADLGHKCGVALAEGISQYVAWFKQSRA